MAKTYINLLALGNLRKYPEGMNSSHSPDTVLTDLILRRLMHFSVILNYLIYTCVHEYIIKINCQSFQRRYIEVENLLKTACINIFSCKIQQSDCPINVKTKK